MSKNTTWTLIIWEYLNKLRFWPKFGVGMSLSATFATCTDLYTNGQVSLGSLTMKCYLRWWKYNHCCFDSTSRIQSPFGKICSADLSMTFHLWFAIPGFACWLYNFFPSLFTLLCSILIYLLAILGTSNYVGEGGAASFSFVGDGEEHGGGGISGIL